MIVIAASVDADRAVETFKRARRDIYTRARSGMKRAAEKAVLPRARREVGTETPVPPGQLVVKTTTTYAYLTASSVKQGRKIGLLNYGGTVRQPIRPRRRRALSFAGVVVSQVNTARRYRGEHFLEDAVEAQRDEFGQALLPEILAAFEPLEHRP